ncbi:hypothetical protein BaRGS_00024925, partial [Batillaria attramentaria]
FVFPTLSQNHVVTYEEDTSVVLPFYVHPTCQVSDDAVIHISKVIDGTRGTVCSIWHQHGACGSRQLHCTCFQNGTYVLHRTVRFADRGIWAWWMGTASATELFFDITRAQVNTIAIRTEDNINSTPEAPSETHDVPTNDIWSGAGAVVLGCVGIVAFTVAATVITIFVLRTKKGKRTRDSQPDPQAEDNEGESQGRPDTPPYHQYWEIQDDSPPPSHEAFEIPNAAADAVLVPTPEPTRESRRDAPVLSPPTQEAVGYLTPVPSRKTTAGAGVTDNRTSAVSSSEICSGSYERPVNPDYTTPNPPYEPLRHLYETVRK